MMYIWPVRLDNATAAARATNIEIRHQHINELYFFVINTTQRWLLITKCHNSREHIPARRLCSHTCKKWSIFSFISGCWQWVTRVVQQLSVYNITVTYYTGRKSSFLAFSSASPRKVPSLAAFRPVLQINKHMLLLSNTQMVSNIHFEPSIYYIVIRLI